MSWRKTIYKRYLNSGHWQRLRKSAFERDNYKCINCGSNKKLRGHHIKYRRNLKDCIVDDIQTLCEKCHDKYHKEKRQKRKEARKLKPRKFNPARLIGNFSATDLEFEKILKLFDRFGYD